MLVKFKSDFRAYEALLEPAPTEQINIERQRV